MSDEYFVGESLREAEAALLAGDLPIGTVVVVAGAVRARARWAWERDHDLLAHPEIVAVRSAGAGGGTLFTTLEPCVMCIGAAMSGFLALTTGLRRGELLRIAVSPVRARDGSTMR